MKHTTHFDAIIVGGSYSGLAAAMALGRALRTVLIVDDGKPCNQQTPHSYNFLTNDGKTPAEIAALANLQVSRYKAVKFFKEHCKIPESLGCALMEEGFIQIDNFHETTVPGVFAVGDNASKMRTVANAVAMGTATGIMLSKKMILEEF